MENQYWPAMIQSVLSVWSNVFSVQVQAMKNWWLYVRRIIGQEWSNNNWDLNCIKLSLQLVIEICFLAGGQLYISWIKMELLLLSIKPNSLDLELTLSLILNIKYSRIINQTLIFEMMDRQFAVFDYIWNRIMMHITKEQ